MKSNWTIEQLKTELSQRSELKGWLIQVEHLHRRERYFMQDGPQSQVVAVDQDREVKQQNIRLRIFVKKNISGRQGEIEKRLSQALPLQEQIRSAIEAALQTDIQQWDLPEKTTETIPQVKTADPKMQEDLESAVREVSEKIMAAASRKREGLRFNSGELFLSNHDNELHLSNGLVHRSSRTKIYAEAAFSTLLGKKSDEYLHHQWATTLSEISIEKIFEEAAARALHTSEVKAKPQSGNYAVIVEADVLDQLLHDYLMQLSGGSKYLGLPFIAPGEELVKDAKGDLISITLDPFMEYGADSAAVSADGLLQRPLEVVKDNKVLVTLCGKQYAEYLKTTPSTTRGNVVIPPGKASYEELLRSQPKVLEILQFSALFTDPHSGTFSSEIRLGRIYDREKDSYEYIKGGSLSGSIYENFRNVRFSNKQVRRSTYTPGMSASGESASGYLGPEYALLSEVSVVG